MTQAERGRLVALKKAKKKPITQKQAAEEIPIPWRAQAGWTKKARIRGVADRIERRVVCGWANF